MDFLSFVNSLADYPDHTASHHQVILAKAVFPSSPVSRIPPCSCLQLPRVALSRGLDSASVYFKPLPKPSSSYPTLALLTAVPFEALVWSNLSTMPSVVGTKDNHNAEAAIEIEDSPDSASDASDFDFGRPAVSVNMSQGHRGQDQARPRGIPDCFKSAFDQWYVFHTALFHWSDQERIGGMICEINTMCTLSPGQPYP